MTKNAPIRSPFEEAWGKAPSGHRIFTKRTQAIDSRTSLLHAPTEYVYEEITAASDVMPTEQQVIELFVSFVRGEFGTDLKKGRGECPPRLRVNLNRETSLDVAFNYLTACEDLVYGGFVDGLIAGAGDKMGDQIYALLSDARLGNVENNGYVSRERFAGVVEGLNAKKARLQFVLPGFPFKDQNIFRVNAPPTHVDLAEIALLVRMHVLVLALYQIHPYGADWIVVTDGRAYARIFGVQMSEVDRYVNGLLDIRNRLNLQRTISVIDLDEMAHRLVSKERGSNIFDETCNYIEQSIRRAVVKGDQDLGNTFATLVRGMKWNSNYKEFFKQCDVSWEDAWTLLNTTDVTEVPSTLKDRWQQLNEMAVNTAARYAAYNLTLRYHDAIKRFLPDSARGTIHAKENQVATPSIGKAPWNGVCAVAEGRLTPESVEAVELWRLQKKCPDYAPYGVRGAEGPLYYGVSVLPSL